MSRTRLILLGLLSAVAVSVIATASTSTPASASGSCSKVKTVPGYCVEGAPLESASEKIEGTNSGEATLKTTMGGVASEVKCEKGTSKGTIEGGAAGAVGKSTMADTFEKCRLAKPTNCQLSEQSEREIKTESLGGELVLTSGRVEDKLKPKSGTIFAAIGIEGKETSCVISHVGEEKVFTVTGSQLCELDSNNTAAEKEEPTHKIICKSSGSSLEIGTSSIPAEMTSEVAIKLTSGKKWSIKET
jgi:hypothetical protein